MYNPKAAGDCAFEAMLTHARMRRTAKLRRLLRKRVADCIRDACEKSTEIIGVSPLPYIRQHGTSLEKYCSEVEKGLWASRSEVASIIFVLNVIKLSLYKGHWHYEEIGECHALTPMLKLRKGTLCVGKVSPEGGHRGGLHAERKGEINSLEIEVEIKKEK